MQHQCCDLWMVDDVDGWFVLNVCMYVYSELEKFLVTHRFLGRVATFNRNTGRGTIKSSQVPSVTMFFWLPETQCCGSGSGQIRTFFSRIRIRNFHYKTGYVAGSNLFFFTQQQCCGAGAARSRPFSLEPELGGSGSGSKSITVKLLQFPKSPNSYKNWFSKQNLHVNQQILKTFCLLQVTDFFDTFLLELELELEPEPEPPKLKSLEPEPPKWAAPTTLHNS